jgi:hypothetical protein
MVLASSQGVKSDEQVLPRALPGVTQSIAFQANIRNYAFLG